EPARVVVGLRPEAQVVGGEQVPLLARHLTGLAADAERRVGEEPEPFAGIVGVRLRPALGVHHPPPGRTASRGRGRWRPGRMAHVATLLSWMWTFGSITIASRSLAESPLA